MTYEVENHLEATVIELDQKPWRAIILVELIREISALTLNNELGIVLRKIVESIEDGN